jgi:hypothetical protein
MVVVVEERRVGAKQSVQLSWRGKMREQIPKCQKCRKTSEWKSSCASGLNFERFAKLGFLISYVPCKKKPAFGQMGIGLRPV